MLLPVVAVLLALANAGDGHFEVLRPQDERGITVEGLAEAGGRRQYSCPARFVRMGNSCYFMSTLMAPWHEAHFRCRSMGAHLAAFEKRWENRNMRKFLMREELARLPRWIGGIYQWEKRFWMWGSSGLPVTFKAFPRRMVTQDWAWHCIAMDPVSEYHWRPASCFDVKHYICETPLRRSSSGKGGKTQGKAHPPASSDPGCPATGQQGNNPRKPGLTTVIADRAGHQPSPTSRAPTCDPRRRDEVLQSPDVAPAGRPTLLLWPPQRQRSRRPPARTTRPMGGLYAARKGGFRPPRPPAAPAPAPVSGGAQGEIPRDPVATRLSQPAWHHGEGRAMAALPQPGPGWHRHAPPRSAQHTHAVSGASRSPGGLPSSPWLGRVQMEMAEATVKSLRPPMHASENNDLSKGIMLPNNETY